MKLDGDQKAPHFHPESRKAKVFLAGSERRGVVYADEEGRYARTVSLDENGVPLFHKVGPKRGQLILDDFWGDVRIDLPDEIRALIDARVKANPDFPNPAGPPVVRIAVDPAVPGRDVTVVSGGKFGLQYRLRVKDNGQIIRIAVDPAAPGKDLTVVSGGKLSVYFNVGDPDSSFTVVGTDIPDTLTSTARIRLRGKLADAIRQTIEEFLKTETGRPTIFRAYLLSRTEEQLRQDIVREGRRVIKDDPDGHEKVELVFTKWNSRVGCAKLNGINPERYPQVLAALQKL